jgi:hypothetical protein
VLVGPRGYAPREALVLEGTSGLLRANRAVVAIRAPDRETTIAVARALRLYDDGC